MRSHSDAGGAVGVDRIPWILSMVNQVAGRALRSMFAVVLTTLLLMSACASEPGLPPDAAPELLLGQEIYRARCQSCHGPSGGGGIGPSIREIETRLDNTEQRTIIVQGRNNMPRFESVLSDEEIDAVVRYVREVL